VTPQGTNCYVVFFAVRAASLEEDRTLCPGPDTPVFTIWSKDYWLSYDGVCVTSPIQLKLFSWVIRSSGANTFPPDGTPHFLSQEAGPARQIRQRRRERPFSASHSRASWSILRQRALRHCKILLQCNILDEQSGAGLCGLRKRRSSTIPAPGAAV